MLRSPAFLLRVIQSRRAGWEVAQHKVYRLITKAHASIASFLPKGNSKSQGGLGAPRDFSVYGCPCCKGFEPLDRGFFGTSPPFFWWENPTPRLFFQFIKQALCKVAQSTLQQPEHTTKQSILNQRQGCHLAYKWCLWLFTASNTIHRGVRGNLN